MTLHKCYSKELILLLVCFFSSPILNAEENQAHKPNAYSDIILKDQPVAYWRFEGNSKTIQNHPDIINGELLNGTIQGSIEQKLQGPHEPEFKNLPLNNNSIKLKKPFGQITIKDPGDNSPIDFKNGESLTIEAWVNPDIIQKGGIVYILGKGRSGTGNKSINQNYSLRLNIRKGYKGFPTSFKISFLFHTAGKEGSWHRWTSSKSLTVGNGWHHIALTYQFGKPKSIKGYLDGNLSTGRWDKKGETTKEPFVDNDNVIIGSSMNKNPGSSYNGLLDEVVLYKKSLTLKQIKKRYEFKPKPIAINWNQVPNNQIQVEIHEHFGVQKSWLFRSSKHTDTFTMDRFAFPEIPRKYTSKGVQADRTSPFLMRALGKVRFPNKEMTFLVRARNGSRLYIDNKLVLETGFHNIAGTAHGIVDEKDYRLTPDMPNKTRGDKQNSVKIKGDGKLHNIRFEMIVGGQRHRYDLGETAVCFSEKGKGYQVLSPSGQPVIPFTEQHWREHLTNHHKNMHRINSKRRRVFGQAEDKKWATRHSQIKTMLSKLPPIKIPDSQSGFRENNVIDKFINTKLSQKKIKQSIPLTDLEFLRKLSIDTQGTVPTSIQIQTFLADSSPQKRDNAIDRFLKEEGWADNWMGYWQDVLAENPNIINPTLNNTGPFRWWIHESFFENKSFDRFVSELILMEGSTNYGGPAGFRLASQNDVPYAAKAHIIGQAFLAANMKCARCHDAPFRDFKQKDLFSIAAMLKRTPQAVPKSSSIPGFDPKTNSMMVQVTLKPGEKVAPDWPFKNIVHSRIIPTDKAAKKPIDSRQQLADLIISPNNKRFSKVIANRIWKRYLGAGLIEPVDDWTSDQKNPLPLLDYLSKSFMSSGYNIKTLAKLIFQSDLYQRKSVTDFSDIDKLTEPYDFSSPVHRIIEAEQIVDSLFVITEKSLKAGHMSLDLDGARESQNSIHLGTPRRAWEFSSSSNERDRPSLSLPFTEPFLDLMTTFGWRDTRQEPITERDRNSTALQPAIMANGTLSQRFTRCSDDSAFTHLALKKQSLKQLIDTIFLKTLTRYPNKKETIVLTNLLSEGYENRITDKKAVVSKPIDIQHLVTWSNHLHPRANEIKLELQKIVQNGDAPSPRLNSDWRERYEDVLWAMWNSPEFLYLP